jgi:hypothetical protein
MFEIAGGSGRNALSQENGGTVPTRSSHKRDNSGVAQCQAATYPDIEIAASLVRHYFVMRG